MPTVMGALLTILRGYETDTTIPPRVDDVEDALECALKDRILYLLLDVDRTQCGEPVREWRVVMHGDGTVSMRISLRRWDGDMYTVRHPLVSTRAMAISIVQYVERATVCYECGKLDVDHSMSAKARFA